MENYPFLDFTLDVTCDDLVWDYTIEDITSGVATLTLPGFLNMNIDNDFEVYTTDNNFV